MSLRRLVFILFVALLLAACGNKGPLVKPSAKTDAPAANTAPASSRTPGLAESDSR